MPKQLRLVCLPVAVKLHGKRCGEKCCSETAKVKKQQCWMRCRCTYYTIAQWYTIVYRVQIYCDQIQVHPNLQSSMQTCVFFAFFHIWCSWGDQNKNNVVVVIVVVVVVAFGYTKVPYHVPQKRPRRFESWSGASRKASVATTAWRRSISDVPRFILNLRRNMTQPKKTDISST